MIITELKWEIQEQKQKILENLNKYTLHTQFYKQIYPHVNLRTTFTQPLGFPGGSDGTESACNVGDPGLIPGS